MGQDAPSEPKAQPSAAPGLLRNPPPTKLRGRPATEHPRTPPFLSSGTAPEIGEGQTRPRHPSPRQVEIAGQLPRLCERISDHRAGLLTERINADHFARLRPPPVKPTSLPPGLMRGPRVTTHTAHTGLRPSPGVQCFRSSSYHLAKIGAGAASWGRCRDRGSFCARSLKGRVFIHLCRRCYQLTTQFILHT